MASTRRHRIRARNPASLEVWLRYLAPIAALLFALFELAPLWKGLPGRQARAAPVAIDHHFRGCDEARAIGMTNIPASDPSYRAFMDGDGDGLACEPHRRR